MVNYIFLNGFSKILAKDYSFAVLNPILQYLIFQWLFAITPFEKLKEP